MRKDFMIALFIVVLSLAAAPLRAEKLRGKALYDDWQKLNLVKTTGKSQVTWLPGGVGYLESETETGKGTAFFKVDPHTGKRAPLFDAGTHKAILDAYRRLTGKSQAAMPFTAFTYLQKAAGIRFSDGSGEYVYFFATKKMRQLKKPTPGAHPEAAAWIQQGRISPDFSRFAYVKDYDLWIYDGDTGKEEPLTSGGCEQLRNGCTDWIYPEELDQAEAFWWSADGKKIAYLQFDEHAVYNFPIIHDLTPERKPSHETVLELERYPKAGRANPTVRLFVIDPAVKRPVEIATASSPDVYLARIGWRNDGSEVIFQRLNRFQNRLELMAGDPQTGKARTILAEEEPCFINLHNDFQQLADNRRFAWSSERSGWKHLYLYDFSGRLVSTLTVGEWEATSISLIDEKNGWVYFTIADNVGLDTLFGRVRLNGKGLTRLTREAGIHRISIEPAGRYYTDSFSSLAKPQQVTLHSADGKPIRTLASSTIEKVKELGLQEPELVKLKAADGKTDVYGILFKPADFDPAKKYPLYVRVYGGPSHRNLNSYQTAGERAQLAQLGFIVWELDGRGTTRRGKRFLTETYLKFGQVDVDDQAAAVQQLRERPYIDGSRVGMTGGSFGGYMTCMSLLRYPDVYSMGVAVSSVTDWRSYDSIYTERYMRTPDANPDGYAKGSALTHAKNLKGKLLLVHGTIDNNVHPGNSLHLADLLQKEGKSFDMMVYPENRHGIRGYSAQHMAKLRLDYFLRHLKPENWEESQKTVW